MSQTGPETEIRPAHGNLGVLVVGLGAVTTTLIAGVEAVNRGLAKPIGSVTEIGRIRLGKRTEGRNPLIKEFVPLAELQDLRFGGWDIIPQNAYETALEAKVLDREQLEPLKDYLSGIEPMPGVFDNRFVKRLHGEYVKESANKMNSADQVMDDIQTFRRREHCDRLIMLYAASTEAYMDLGPEQQSIEALEKAMRANSPNISPSMVYAYAALRLGIPFINGTPGFAVDTPAMIELAKEEGVPVAGKDFKTGQTLLKTALAPMFKARMLGVDGWYSFNVLGNKDGLVLQDPGSFESKRVTKSSVLDTILPPEQYPDLYGDLEHRVRIEYYGPAGDDKEAWDRIDFRGWMGKRMGLRIDFQCKDSILAAPVALDLVRFMDLAQRSGMKGVQEWLSFYFKEPMVPPVTGLYAEHDLAIQQMKMKNMLRHLRGEPVITHLGQEYYE